MRTRVLLASLAMGELALCGYALAGFILALDRLPLMAPTLGLVGLSFGFVAGIELWEQRGAFTGRLHVIIKRRKSAQPMRNWTGFPRWEALVKLSSGAADRREKNHS